MWVSTGAVFALLFVGIAIGAGDDAHRAGAAGIAAASLLVAVMGWRANRIVTHSRGLDITADVRTRHLLWREVASFSYEVGPTGPIGITRQCLVVTLKSGAMWRIPQISSSPSRGDRSRVAKVVANLSAQLAEHDELGSPADPPHENRR